MDSGALSFERRPLEVVFRVEQAAPVSVGHGRLRISRS
jgi:hypothetical protein